MPPYRYEPYQNRFAGSIADMMQRGAEIRARAAMQAADAQAQATASRGQIWGNALANVGQAIASIPAQVQQAKAQQQQLQMRQMELEQAKAEQAAQAAKQADVNALDRAFSPAAALGPGGQGPMPEGAPLPDRDTVLRALPGHLQPVAVKHFQEIDDAKKKDRETRNDYWASLAAGVHAFGNTPEAAMIALRDAAEDYPDQARAIFEQIQQNPNPEFIGQLTNSLMVKSPKYAEQLRKSEPKTREVTVTNPDGSTTIQIVKDEPGQTFTSAPKPAADVAPGTFGDYLKRVAGEQGKSIGQLSAGEVRKAKEQFEAAGRAPSAASQNRMWVMRNGEAIFIPESAVQPGDKPANTREQGRPVTSGDAGRIADLDTSLNDLATLRQQLGTTGAGSKVGAMLPNVVTEYTGWGSNAKERQGTIDRVKQVIGKALEGGVLRKEDEYKYEKILPTIGDPPDVAVAKLNGLEAALKQRRQTTIDALADANYDVSKYAARTAAAASTPTAAPGLLTPGNIDLTNRPRVTNPDGSISTVRSMSINENGKEILIPTVVNGRVVSDREAIAAYHKTGQHLGIFDSAQAATAYAQKLHEAEAQKLTQPVKVGAFTVRVK